MEDTKPIIVPLDRTEKDGRAVAVALALGRLAGAPLHLLHVFAQATGAEPEPSAGPRAAAERDLASVAQELRPEAGHGITVAVEAASDVADAIVRRAEAQDALAVVLGTRAPNVVGRALAGSVADRVMRECARPVVLVPPRASYMAGRRVQFGRVLVPFDGSALAEQALEFLLRLPHATALEYVLLEVVRPASDSQTLDPDGNTGQYARGIAEAEADLARAASRARAHGVKAVEIRVEEARDAAPAIVDAIREDLVEMIAMSTRGAGGLRRLVLGSVAEGVVRRSEVPVVLITPAALARTSAA